MPPIQTARRHRHQPRNHDHILTAAVLAVLAVSVPAQQRFAELTPQLPVDPAGALSVAMGDVDADGDLDMVCGQIGRTTLYLNDGHGRFSDVTASQMPPGTGWGNAIALGDIDGDGDLDIAEAVNGQNRLMLNDGSGTFLNVTATHMPASPWSLTEDVVLGDIDGDGDLDLVFAENGYTCGPYPTLIHRNDGNGVFTNLGAPQLPLTNGLTEAVAFGDVDGDGDLDLICGNRSFNYFPYQASCAQDRLYLNDGVGTFSEVTTTHLPASSNSQTYWIELADFDGDGDLDVASGSGLSRLYENNGLGVFVDVTATNFPAGVCGFVSAHGDVDGDGDLDLVLGGGGCQSRLLLNDGSGHFADTTAVTVPAGEVAYGMALADVDGDGDLDLAATYLPSLVPTAQNRLYVNLQRQLDAPTSPQIGQPYSLDAYLRYGPTSTIDLAAIYLSTAPASIASPFGTLGIDPALAVPFPTLVIPQPAGIGSVGFTIPNVPGLIGQVIYSQAMLVAYPNDLRLSNVVRDVIAP